MTEPLQGIKLPPVKIIQAGIADHEGFHSMDTLYPGMAAIHTVGSINDNERQCSSVGPWFDHEWRITKILEEPTGLKRSCPLTIRIEKNVGKPGVSVQDVSGFRKVTHILDPDHWIKGKYQIPVTIPKKITKETYGEKAWEKTTDTMNHAYVEALASFALGKLRENNFSPHFHKFYGAFTSIADNYTYNITDSFVDYRVCRWFWQNKESGLFEIGFEEDVPQEVRESVCLKPDDLTLSDESCDSSNSDKDKDEEILTVANVIVDETASLKSAEEDDFEKGGSEDDEDSEDDSEDEDSEDELNIFAEIKNFPVMMLFTETSESTMDDLLDDYEEVGAEPGSPEWEMIWSAWVFQVIAALCVAQATIGFTHNDLHSNNIVWSKTEIEYLYYKTRLGVTYKVPTFGKIFRIIDFGRAIFKINGTQFFSDDFRKDNDADDQYNFGEIYDSDKPIVEPNPSFDLCRFTVSVFEAIFPESPDLKKKAKILSAEPDLIIKETVSPLYNLLWSWLICDDGHNVLMNPDGSERYPDFDLYTIIASEVHGAIPSMHLDDESFAPFIVSGKKVPKDVTVYSLFC